MAIHRRSYDQQSAPSLTGHDSGLANAVLYSLFLLTGTALVLPGTLLPLLSARWHMSDGRAGILFLVFSVGSSVGALLARGRLSRALAVGCLMTALGAAALGANWSGAPLFVIAVYGCGLGLAMTSISLIQSRRRPEQRITEMTRLNLTWALGACFGPPLLLWGAAAIGTTEVLRITAFVFCLAGILAFASLPSIRAVETARKGSLRELRAIPWMLLVLIPLATGIESAVGGWLSTYAARTGAVLNVTVSTTTAFWVGLLFSRLYHSRHRDTLISRRRILTWHPWMIVAGLLVIVSTARPAEGVCAAFLVGAGIAPLYPLLLALVLDCSEAGNTGFLLGGIGASTLPMLTGMVSGWRHSIRDGMSVMLVFALVAALLSARLAVHRTHSSRNAA